MRCQSVGTPDTRPDLQIHQVRQAEDVDRRATANGELGRETGRGALIPVVLVIVDPLKTGRLERSSTPARAPHLVQAGGGVGEVGGQSYECNSC